MEEPVRSVRDNKQEIKTSNICRLIFCAEIVVHYEDIVHIFDTTIKEKQSEFISGLLLVHSKFVIHLLESSEEIVYQLCNEVFATYPGVMAKIKCLYAQNGAKKRFFKKWYSKKLNDSNLAKEEEDNIQDNFETVSAVHKAIIINLHNLYNELWNTCMTQGHENFIKQLDSITKQGDPRIPHKTNMEFILNSRWGYDLAKLANDYCNLKYPYDFDDTSAVANLISGIDFDIDERLRKMKLSFTVNESDDEQINKKI